MLRRNILHVIKTNPGIDTRDVIWFFNAAGVNKHKVCGCLSVLKRTKQITILTLHPGRCSFAY